MIIFFINLLTEPNTRMSLPQFTFMSSAPSDSPFADTSSPDVLEQATLFSYPEEMEDCCVFCDPETDSNGNTSPIISTEN